MPSVSRWESNPSVDSEAGQGQESKVQETVSSPIYIYWRNGVRRRITLFVEDSSVKPTNLEEEHRPAGWTACCVESNEEDERGK